jgi:predicted dehydrogenase
MAVIRWGIIGCGDVTEVKSGPAFQKARGSELVAVMRRDGAKAADYARRHGVARWYDDADLLIADKDVDAVYVATPPGTHELYAMKVLAAGKPCYVEKPMARCASEARRMVEGFKAEGVPLFVAYYRRALPRFLKVREILRSGVLGDVRTIGYRYADLQMQKRLEPVPWRLRAVESGGGPFLDLGSHALDLMDFWVGPLSVNHAEAKNVKGTYDVEDSLSIAIHNGRGTAGVSSWCFSCQPVDEFVLLGQIGELRASCFGNAPICLKGRGGAEETFDLPNPPHIQQPLIQTVVDELLGLGKCESTGESGLRTQLVMDAALEKYYGGREDGFWKREWPRG